MKKVLLLGASGLIDDCGATVLVFEDVFWADHCAAAGVLAEVLIDDDGHRMSPGLGPSRPSNLGSPSAAGKQRGMLLES